MYIDDTTSTVLSIVVESAVQPLLDAISELVRHYSLSVSSCFEVTSQCNSLDSGVTNSSLGGNLDYYVYNGILR